MRAAVVLVCALGAVLAGVPALTDRPAGATPGVAPRGPRIETRLTRVASVTGGTSLAWRKGDPIPYLALQQGQVVPIVEGRAGRAVLDVGDRLASGRERGLLGLTFSPDGRRMYVYFTATPGDNTLEEYRVTARPGRPVRVDPASRRTLLVLGHEKPTHNGGQLAFGRDRMLYVAVGDAGGHRGVGPDQVPGGNSQSLDNLFGKILRIDPRPSGDRPYTVPADNPFAGGGGRPEIWHYGLRNPWRFSFDPTTGKLWIGDVGQDHAEEIDVVPGTARGLNFGYPLVEGRQPLNAPEAPGTVAPVYELEHGSGNCAVTGGVVYRGSAIPRLRGYYLFADYCRGRLKAIRFGDEPLRARLRLRAPLVSSFAVDPTGEVFVVSQARGVLRLEPS